MDRRSFLKGLLTSTALVALPLPMIFAKGGIVKTTPYVIFADLPLCEFGNRLPNFIINGSFELWREGQRFDGNYRSDRWRMIDGQTRTD